MMLILMLIMMLKFCVKEPCSLIALEKFGAARFSITAVLEWCSPHQSKSDQIDPSESPTPSFYIHQFFTLSLLEIEDYCLKTKMVTKIFNNKISQFPRKSL